MIFIKHLKRRSETAAFKPQSYSLLQQAHKEVEERIHVAAGSIPSSAEPCRPAFGFIKVELESTEDPSRGRM